MTDEREGRQLPLPLALKEHTTFASFHPGPNRALVAQLRGLARGEREGPVYIWGAPASGRSHLLQAVCHEAGACGRQAAYLPLREAAALAPEMLEGLEALDLVCWDDIHAVAGRGEWEEALFNCFNRLRDAGKALVVSGDGPVAGLALALQDLHSRLGWASQWRLHELSDADKIQMLQLRARQRAIELPPAVARYILSRSERGHLALLEVLDGLDHASLVEKRKLTIPFVKSVMGW